MTRKRNFGSTCDTMAVPNLSEIQTAAYNCFLQPDCLPGERESVGLEKLFREFFPIETSENGLRIEYLGYTLGAPSRGLDECHDLDLTYAHPLHVRLRTVGVESIEEDVYLGEVPKMIEPGQFVINGSARVIVSQIQRSPGVDFSKATCEDGQQSCSCRFVPERGVWIEFGVSRKHILQLRLGRSGRMPATWLLRAMLPQASTDAKLLRLFYAVEAISLTSAGAVRSADGRFLADEIVDRESGEVVAAAGEQVSIELADTLTQAGMKEISVLKNVDDPLLLNTIAADPCKDHAEALLRIYGRFRPGVPASIERAAAFFAERLADQRNYSLGRGGRFRINRKLGQNVPTDRLTLCPEDILNAIRYLIRIRRREGEADDIDHLGNRVLRTIDKLLEGILWDAFRRWVRSLREQLAVIEEGVPSPRAIASTRTLAGAFENFFSRGELSQVVDQTNPLAELNHIRRISALGPGGLSRKRAGFEVRDVHASHYGRICPIETPEGPNIGLIASLGVFAKVDEFGFITAPYKKFGNGDAPPRYFRADEEEGCNFAPAGAQRLPGEERVIRRGGELDEVAHEQIDFVDISPKQMVGVSASLIPFLEHNDANRALMGSNMQRQAVPLLRTEMPLVATGMEHAVAAYSGMVVVAERDGEVSEVDSSHITIGEDTYPLKKFQRLNEDTCLNQRPIVHLGERVSAGQIVADGAATSQGELSLGRNVLVAFMIWHGYNFEDAIIISESLVQEDKYTSVHIEEFAAELRETQLGCEEFSNDIPNIPEKMLANLNTDGLIRIGARVQPGDILVGKVAPKGKSELTPEEKLLREIFGAAGVDVSNESLVVPPGASGIVVDVRHYRRQGKKNDQERSDSQRQSRKIRAEYAERLAEAIIAMFHDLARLPLLAAETLPPLPHNPTARNWISLEEEYSFNPNVFAPEHREEARRKYMAHTSVIEALKVRRDQLLRKLRSGDELSSGVLEMAKIYVAVKRPIAAGDKMAGRHGNKGVIARVVPREDMPFLPDGTSVEMILNPLGVPSRMNVGQIFETHLAWAGKALGFRAICPVFDGATEAEIRACLREAGLPEDGKIIAYDGRSGEPFSQKITIGRIYMMKLNHLADAKIHARATGPYSLITQQPLGGKTRAGGQRLGEMEVWALEAYGAAYSLQEMMTVKSDDVDGRAQIYESIIKGGNVLHASTPVSFDVLVQEMRGLGLNLERTERRKADRGATGAAAGGAPARISQTV